jgi:hypothetical protein
MEKIMAYLDFYKIVKQLQMLDGFGVNFSRLRQIAQKNLYRHVLDAKSVSKDLDLHETWFEICKVHCVLTLEDLWGRHFRVAVYLESDPEETASILSMLHSTGFNTFRKALNIQRHWVVRMDQDHLPTWQQVVDVIYEAIDQSTQIALVDFIPKVRSRSTKSTVLIG